jgi:starch phosphorylase
MVRPIATISVAPNLPANLERLLDLAYNLRWSWDHETIALFLRLDYGLWMQTDRNPVEMLGLISQERLEEASNDPSFLTQLDQVWAGYQAYMQESRTWYAQQYGMPPKPTIAYFSMEFGLTTCFKNYSGGLGVLSGDHLKSASDLGLPLVAVGLLYQEGYFRQYLNAAGYQQEDYPINDYSNQPISPVMTPEGRRMTLTIPLTPQQKLTAFVWKVQVGRIALYLLDANHPDNPSELRGITDRLYGGDKRNRIRQEILLGIGGMRMLHDLGIEPKAVHMNEGHSALLALERVRLLMKDHPGLNFEQASTVLASSSVYTIHTPVPAGLERFGYDLIDEHLPWLWAELRISREEFHNLGREQMGGYDLFSLPVMALKFASNSNGVSQLHGEVSRQMWQWMFPQLPTKEVPVGAITNGVHVQSWTSREMARLFDRYIGLEWRTDNANPEVWKNVDNIPDAELWRAHEVRRERLVTFARERLKNQYTTRGFPPNQVRQAEDVLNPDVLTIGFARRFATYKRATLIFNDLERLNRIVNSSDRPVQIIFAGKAHPHDKPGKEFIRQIVQFAAMPEFRNSVVFLDNYDMTVARYLVQGVDVWLNNPQRPQEASGTSGMKVIYNGGLNASVLDGWWDEAYDPNLGWAIGNREIYGEDQLDLQNEIESEALYNILENAIAPLFYTRDRNDLPREWLRMVKNSMRALSGQFSTDRMLMEYTKFFYAPAAERFDTLMAGKMERAYAYAKWLHDLRLAWGGIKILDVQVTDTHQKVNTPLTVKAVVELGKLTPEDVNVQIYTGTLDTNGSIINGDPFQMYAVGGTGGKYQFEGRFSYGMSGDHGLSVRVLPKHRDLPDPFLTGYICWASQ